MHLVTTGSAAVFDPESIHKGDLIRAQYHTWPEPRNGLVAQVLPRRLSVLFLPGLGNASNYFPIAAQEAAEGKWKVLWSTDLEDIHRAEEAGDGA